MPAGDSGEAARMQRNRRYDVPLPKGYKPPVKKHFGSKGNVIIKKGKEDPVIGFLKGAANFVSEVGAGAEETARMITGGSPTKRKVAAVRRDVGKAGARAIRGYVKDRKQAFTSPHEYSKTHPSSMDVSPGPLSAIVKAGGATLLNPGKLNLTELVNRFPAKHGGPARMAARIPSSRALGDINVKGRIPWLVERETGRVHVGPVGENHVRLYPPGRAHSDFRQGWMYNPSDEFASITLGTGNPLTPLSAKEEKGLYQLLYHMLGRDSPVTDAMVKTKGTLSMTGNAPLGARQGSRADDLLENIGGVMSSKEFNHFLQNELMRRKGIFINERPKKKGR